MFQGVPVFRGVPWCSGVFRCSGVPWCSGVFRCSGVPGCSDVPAFSTCDLEVVGELNFEPQTSHIT